MRLSPILLALVAVPLAALENPLTGSRQLGMGASGTAVVEDQTAPWWNPAALGWDAGAAAGPHPGYGSLSPGGIGLDVHAGVRVYGDIISNADRLLDFAEKLKDIGENGIQDTGDLRDWLKLAGSLNAFADPADSLSATANMAGSVRIGRFAVGIRMGGEAFAWADDVDLRNVVPEVGGAQLADAINSSGQSFDSTFQVLSSDQQQSIYASLGGTGTVGTDAAATEATYRIDAALRDLGAAAPVAADAAEWIVAAANGDGTLDQNTTSVVITGFTYVEVPVSLGVPINDHVAIGGSLKLMSGRVHGTRILVFQEDVEEAVVDLKGDNKDSINLGIDLGMQVKAGDWRFAISGRNLNAPTFEGPVSDGEKVRDIRLDPQVTFGFGWRPADWLTVAADIEQFEIATINPEIESRRAGIGLEFAAIPWVALRGGCYGNLADEHSPPVLTAGAAFGPSWFHVDTALACATELEEFGDYELPSEMRLSIGVAGIW